MISLKNTKSFHNKWFVKLVNRWLTSLDHVYWHNAQAQARTHTNTNTNTNRHKPWLLINDQSVNSKPKNQHQAFVIDDQQKPCRIILFGCEWNEHKKDCSLAKQPLVNIENNFGHSGSDNWSSRNSICSLLIPDRYVDRSDEELIWNVAETFLCSSLFFPRSIRSLVRSPQPIRRICLYMTGDYGENKKKI